MTGREKRGIGNSKGRKKELRTHHLRLHDVFLSTDFILKKVFRKDGPPLGVEFDSLSSQAFRHCKKGRLGSKNSHCACQENQRALQGNKGSRNCDLVCNENQRAIKRRKVSEPTLSDYQVSNKKSALVKQHGIGKGLMTVWRAINPDGGDFPTGVNFKERESTTIFQMSTFASPKPFVQEKKKSRKRQPVARKTGKLTKKQDKRKPLIRRRKVEGNTTKKQKQPRKQKCELALEVVRCQEDLEQFALLMDDEELELRELQEGPNPITCCAHLTTNGLHGCSLCKDLLAKFPPNSVMMRLPFCMQPWGSSAELVKKLFKVFHFLYTYAVTFNIGSFTLDEFAQAFNDKESMLLGKIHLAILKQLLSDLEVELSRGFLPHASKNGNFVELLHSVEHQQFVLEFWMKSLNPLTCTEILRQVFVAAGFGSKSSTLRKHTLNKEVNCMEKYGLSPDTLKGVLFIILSEQGNNGMKVYDLAKSSRIVDLNLAATSDELELLISSTLSSDITLFEKISHSAYRLRILSITKEAENFELDPEDCGSIDEYSNDHDSYTSSDDSEYDPGTSALSKLKREDHCKTDNNRLTVDTEIDESHPGEVWLLGLMEGEYSDLSIEEKLNALVALIDRLTVGSSIRMEDPTGPVAECVPNNHYGSGAKIKRASVKQHKLPTSFGGYCGQMLATKELDRLSGLQPKDSSASISTFFAKANSCSQRKDAKETEVEGNLHPMQSIFLGSDRRYNRYWLFLGPCNANDPGHKSIYFESSEDGHWEVVDTEEALCTLLSALDCRGRREAHLLASLKKRETFLCQAMSKMLNDAGTRQLTHSDQSELNISREDSSSSAVSDVDNNHCLPEISKDVAAPSGAIVVEAGNKGEQQKQKWSRLQAFDAWIWSSFYYDLNAVKYGKRSYLDSLTRCECCHDLYWRDEKHCKTCHTTFELDFDLEERYTIHAATCRENGKTNMYPEHKVLSSQVQLLKAAIHAIESVMPEGALVGTWTKSAHKLWVKRLRRTSTLAEFLQVLADFVDAINEEWLCQQTFNLGSNSVLKEIITSFTTMPQTLSAVALWLVKLDALIAPHFQRILTEK
ncbi:homeobox-DDT domain protein RLT3 isoform X1 [Actinidia eriantha]|uniref:homeobox-DDT domain protein RLT3 isoform X1 n=1 Tax=Actinidia eriantha TaxID=165200 RepID=UPI00258F53E8|nr:homeobox-DDT domain protein RLT3 isoform X1 [Actinidia eriantha]